MAELQRAQQHSKRNRRFIAIGAVVAVAAALAVYSSTRGSSTKVSTATATATTTTTATATTSGTTVAPGSSTGASTAASLAALSARTFPPVVSGCTAKPAAPASATTVPAKGNAVSMVDAPAGVGFPNLDGSSPRYTHFSAAPPFCLDFTKTYTATMTTDVGTIAITLLAKYAPQTVDNFIFLAGYHYFDGTVYHRVIPGFVDQGGDPTATGTGGPGYTIPDESPKAAAAYDDGSVAMANTGSANTGGSQFFLVVGTGGQQLTPTYADFGQITSGLDVAKKINVDGDSANNGSPPKVTHKLLKVTITTS